MQNVTIDKNKTLVLIMDYQNEIVTMLPAGQRALLLERAKRVLQAVRQTGLPVIHSVIYFRDGYPEVSAHNKMVSGAKEQGRLREGTIGVRINEEVEPQSGELMIIRRRPGAFSGTELDAILRAKGIITLVLLGIATSGVVLSTVRSAADLDYDLVVLSDGCADRDEEVHRVLMQKVFPRQSTVVTVEEFLKALTA